ncbi:MAG: flavoprotein [Sulfobacillus sp.]
MALNVLLGASGAINTVNLPHYVSELTRRGHQVKVILTKSAESFVPPAVLRASTGVEVFTDRDFVPELVPHHVALAHWSEVVALAPMTANTLAKVALGISDNLLLATALVEPPTVAAPCMNVAAYQHPVVRAHLAELAYRGTVVLAPLIAASGQGESLRMIGPRQLRRAIEGGGQATRRLATVEARRIDDSH